MTFDIHQLDEIDPYSLEAEKAFEEYQDTLLELFANSPEGKAHLQIYPEMGFWAAQLMYYGYTYHSLTIPQMTAADVELIVTNLFPRKIALSSPDEADDAIPELEAFWQYLKREYQHSNADAILRFLHRVDPNFKSIINDQSKFGMAKSFFTMGQEAGFDMTDEEETQEFIQLYNASTAARSPRSPLSLPAGLAGPLSGSTSRATKAQKKKARKKVKASRRRNRKRK